MWLRWKSGLDFEVWKGLSVLTTGPGGREGGSPKQRVTLKVDNRTINWYLLLFWWFLPQGQCSNVKLLPSIQENQRLDSFNYHCCFHDLTHGHRQETAVHPNITSRTAACCFCFNFWLLILFKKTRVILNFALSYFLSFDKCLNTLSTLFYIRISLFYSRLT